MESREEHDWKILQDKFKDFEKTMRPKLKETLANEIFDLFIRHRKWIMESPEKYDYYNTCYAVFKEWLERNYDVLHNATKQFILSNFNNVKDVSCFNKKNGNQMGTICHVTYTDDTIKKYYIKTHQFGPTESVSKSRKHPDVKELLVYKILENIGLGPKVYFFWPVDISTKTLYIATEEVDIKFYKPEYKVSFTSQEKTELIKLDLISRILCITDSTTNSGNFGYDVANNKAYIIDFGTNEQVSYYTKDLIKDFYSGNKTYNYTGPMKEVVSVSNNEKDRVIKEVCRNLQQCINDAKLFMLDLMNNNINVIINSKEVLEKYVTELSQTINDIYN